MRFPDERRSMALEFNQRAAIAADIQALKNDRDTPIEVEGSVWMGTSYDDMDEGEAARIVVDTVLDHPFVQAAFGEREAYWEALKAMIILHGVPKGMPRHLVSTIFVAADAAMFEKG